MSLWSFALGVVALAGIVGPAAFGARRARRRWFEAEGAAGLLVDVVVTLAQIYAVAFVLGTFGWFRRWPVVVGCLLLGAGIATAARPAPDAGLRPGGTREGDPLPRWTALLAGASAVVVLGQYLAHSLVSLQRGMYDPDTLWYHAPMAVRFVQDGWITRLYFEGGMRIVTYYPANGELAAAVAILPFHRDALLPVLNLGWLALALLAGWCLGRRYGRGPVGLAGVAAALSVPVMATRQGGTVGNDIPGIALLLVAAALLVEGQWRRPWMALSGVAAGLAFGVKLSLFPPVAVLCIAVPIAAPALRRLRSTVVWYTAFVVTALYWPIRNWARTGNPFPWWSVHLGPVRFRALPVDSGASQGTSVLSHLASSAEWSRVFVPGFRISFGLAWPAILVVAALGGVSGLLGRDRAARAVAAVGLLGAVLYAGIPNGALEPPYGQYAFADSLRYAVPAVAVALGALAASRLSVRPAAAAAVTALLTALVVVDQLPRTLDQSAFWPLPAVDVVLGLAFAGAISAAVVAFRSLRWDPLRFGMPALTVLAVLWPVEGVAWNQYQSAAHHREPNTVFAWGQHITHSRIAVFGSWGQYPFFGPDLDNYVHYVSAAGPDGTFRELTTCPSFVRKLDDGHYGYLVIFRPPALVAIGSSSQETWVEGDRNAVLLGRYRDGDVWRILGPLDPARCR